jgi:hypothetical protein
MKPEEYLFPSYDLIDEPDLSFHPDRQVDKSKHPLIGLMKFGPYSRSLINHVVDPIRIASIFPLWSK